MDWVEEENVFRIGYVNFLYLPPVFFIDDLDIKTI